MKVTYGEPWIGRAWRRHRFVKLCVRNCGAPTRARAGRPCRGRGGLCLGAPPTPLVHVVENDIDQDVSRIIHAGMLESQGPQLFGELVPTKELAKIDTVHLEGLDVLEHV